MPELNNIEIERKVIFNTNSDNELVAFCDASLTAYGAFIYLRSVDQSGQTKVNLLCSKTRVSPIKTVSLPCLELCAALLAAYLMEKASAALKVKISKKYFFSDSMIALHYIKADANAWQIFIASRVAQIQNLSSKADWYHVETALKLADLVSRGVYAKDFINNNFYWHGPQFLQQPVELWPLRPLQQIKELSEKRKIILTVNVTVEWQVL